VAINCRLPDDARQAGVRRPEFRGCCQSPGKYPQPRIVKAIDMRKTLIILATLTSVATLPGVGSAHGCIKGAAVGGVVGHVAGHHAVAGAAVGCVVGHHHAKVKEREAAAAQSQDSAAKSTGATPAR
jgi:hypothetical protein